MIDSVPAEEPLAADHQAGQSNPASNIEDGEQSLYRLVEARHGRFLANPRDVYIGRALIDYGEFSELESHLIRHMCPEGGTVAEVGANIGAHTVAIARKVGPAGRVYAFEPQPVVFQNLCANLALNSLTNVYAYNIACGAHRDSLTFPNIRYDVEGNFGGLALDILPESDQGQKIDIVPLDEFDPPQLHFLKIDAEGMEIDVLKGGAEALARHKPILYVENDRPDRSEDLIRLIQGHDYRLWWHIPRLFNPDNWAGNKTDSWPGISSFNMLCIHKSRSTNIAGMREITDPGEHPLKKQSA